MKRRESHWLPTVQTVSLRSPACSLPKFLRLIFSNSRDSFKGPLRNQVGAKTLKWAKFCFGYNTIIIVNLEVWQPISTSVVSTWAGLLNFWTGFSHSVQSVVTRRLTSALSHAVQPPWSSAGDVARMNISCTAPTTCASSSLTKSNCSPEMIVGNSSRRSLSNVEGSRPRLK